MEGMGLHRLRIEGDCYGFSVCLLLSFFNLPSRCILWTDYMEMTRSLMVAFAVDEGVVCFWTGVWFAFAGYAQKCYTYGTKTRDRLMESHGSNVPWSTSSGF